MMSLVIFFIRCLFIYGIIYQINCQQVNLEVVTNPNGCVGGEVCKQQPSLLVVDNFGGILFNFSGLVSVQVGFSPSGDHGLWLGSCNYTSCGTLISGTIGSAPIINGAVQFQNLQINTAGIGYTLKYFGLYSNGVGFGTINSGPFTVVVGDVYRLAFKQYIGTATGGAPFVPNPSIGAVDRGGNVVTTINGFSITVTLQGASSGVQLLPTSATSTSFYNGLGEFAGLYINKAGTGYVMAFNASLVRL